MKTNGHLFFKGLIITCLCAISTLNIAQTFCTDCTSTTGNCAIPTITSNPTLTATCDQLNITLLLDESGSIDGYEDRVKESTLSFLNTFKCTRAKVSIIEFRATARYVQETPRTVDDDYISDITKYFDTGYSGNIFNPFGATNWQHALQLVDDLTVTPNLVVMFTDGNPTAHSTNGYTCGDGDTTQQREIVNPMKIANKLKAEGAHIFTLGVGQANNFETNIQRITGTTLFEPNSTNVNSSNSVTTSDYYLSNNFAALSDKFREFAYDLCPSPIDFGSFEVTGTGLTIDVVNSEVEDGSSIELLWYNENDNIIKTTNIRADSSQQGMQTITISDSQTGLGYWPDGIYNVTVKVLSTSGKDCIKEASARFNLFSAILPVELSVFEIQNDNNNAKLTWQTVSENNNDYFEIQHRYGKLGDFTKIGTSMGNGTTNEVHNYSFIHNNVPIGENYYRLKQFDYDGSFEYSAIKMLAIKQPNALKVYPNPVADYLAIEIPTNTESEVTIMNTQGSIVERISNYSNRERLPVDQLPRGVYIIQVITNNTKSYTKFSKH